MRSHAQAPPRIEAIPLIPLRTEVCCFGRIGAQYSRQLFDRVAWILSGKKRRVPWMKWREIEAIREILVRLQPEKCLEWGSGYSTMYFPRYLPSGATWTGIEDQEAWAEHLNSRNRREGVKVHHIPPERYPWTDADADGARDDLRSYIDFPSGMRGLDFILVDGRARVCCIAKAAEIIRENGIVVLHDANRKMYHRSFEAFRHQVWLHDYRNDSGGLWIGSIGRPLDTVLDLDAHSELWRLVSMAGDTRWGRFLRV